MNTRFKHIKLALKKHGIKIADDAQEIKPCLFNESITNTFFSIRCDSGIDYLIRINGKLWPPFTREHEAQNLSALNEAKIDANIIENDHTNGFQICKSPDKSHQFYDQKFHNVNPVILQRISTEVRSIHGIKYFKNLYLMSNQVTSAYSRLSRENQARFQVQYDYIMKIQHHLFSDIDSIVSSHNDLLPSSIYVYKNSITIVDWEYAGLNHRSYDLALLSIKSNLNSDDQQRLISFYDPTNEFDLKSSFVQMRAVVTFLLLSWHLSSKQINVNSVNTLIFYLSTSIRDVINESSVRCLLMQNRLLFPPNKQKKANFVLDEKDPTKNGNNHLFHLVKR